MLPRINREQFLPTVTTTSGSDWRGKLQEIKRLRIRKISIFPTCLDKAQRELLCRLLKKAKVKEIPFVHLRGDMETQELDYLVREYKCHCFNLHTAKEFPILFDFQKYQRITYIENTKYPWDETEVRNFAGVCIDLAHLENNRLQDQARFIQNQKIIAKYPIGCNHISAMMKEQHINEEREITYSNHFLRDYSELNYLQNYPLSYFSSYIALELENSIAEQLQAVDYIISFLDENKL